MFKSLRKIIFISMVLLIIGLSQFQGVVHAQTLELPNSNSIYLVKAGDSLSVIAQEYHMTLHELKSLNDLKGNIIYVGQKLLVNQAIESSFISYTVHAGDSLWLIANQFHTTIQRLKRLNSLQTNFLYIGEKLKIPHSNNTNALSVKGPLQGKTIVLSPGHGGKDTGAVGNGVVEKKITLQIAQKTEADLKAQGAMVIMARTGDYYVTLDTRANLAAKYHGDIFIAIHVNEFRSSSIHGTTTYYNRTTYDGRTNPYPRQSQVLSTDIVKAVSSAAGTVDRGAKNANYRVLRDNSVPSSLVETAFLSNKQNAADLVSPVWQNKVAKGITDGIEHYFAS